MRKFIDKHRQSFEGERKLKKSMSISNWFGKKPVEIAVGEGSPETQSFKDNKESVAASNQGSLSCVTAQTSLTETNISGPLLSMAHSEANDYQSFDNDSMFSNVDEDKIKSLMLKDEHDLTIGTDQIDLMWNSIQLSGGGPYLAKRVVEKETMEMIVSSDEDDEIVEFDNPFELYTKHLDTIFEIDDIGVDNIIEKQDIPVEDRQPAGLERKVFDLKKEWSYWQDIESLMEKMVGKYGYDKVLKAISTCWQNGFLKQRKYLFFTSIILALVSHFSSNINTNFSSSMLEFTRNCHDLGILLFDSKHSGSCMLCDKLLLNPIHALEFHGCKSVPGSVSFKVGHKQEYLGQLIFSKCSIDSFKCSSPKMALKCLVGSPAVFDVILRSIKTVKPSFNQKCSQFFVVTKFPIQEWAISWATTSTNDRSPANNVGVTNVKQGFSIPPIKKYTIRE